MHLSYQEHEKIYRGICAKQSLRDIAKQLYRAPSTVSREVARNSDAIGYLYPKDAYRRQEQKRKRKNGSKIDRNQKLADYIMEKLKIKWSPKVIAGRWSKDHPDQSITHETIYTWVYRKGNEVFRKSLPRAKPKRGMVRKAIKKSLIKDRVSIHTRPEDINNRSTIGHLEADLIFHKGDMSANILTMVDRKSRYAILLKNESKHSENIVTQLDQQVKKYNMKSITFDNGTEFSLHHRLNTMIPTYFCDPHSPWQKGSVENLNGLVRHRLPFQESIDSINQTRLDSVAYDLNHTPREILNFLTPCEAFQSEFKTCCVL